MNDQNIGNITLEETLNFLLPKILELQREEVEVSNGRYGPYIRHGAAFVSLPKGENPLDVDFDRTKELIDEKALADAPIAVYKGKVQKGTGRFVLY
jgi:DNA topoisomerase-1